MYSQDSSFLDRLGICPEVQSFFKTQITPSRETLIFKYGNSIEHAGENYHRVPITEELWIAGDSNIANQVYISGSAMDAISWLQLNYHQHNNLTNLCFVSTGVSPSKLQTDWILDNLPNRTYHLLFSKDTLGAICDLKVAAAIRKLPLKITVADELFTVVFRNKQQVFDKLSLNALEKAAGYHFNIPAHKPKTANTFFEQLKHGY